METCIICNSRDGNSTSLTFILQNIEVFVCDECCVKCTVNCSMCDITYQPYDTIYLIPPIDTSDWSSLCGHCGAMKPVDIADHIAPHIRLSDKKRLIFVLEQMMAAKASEIERWLESTSTSKAWRCPPSTAR